MTEQLYKKVGRRYIPIGYSDGFNGFPSDGIWLVQQSDSSKSSECIIKYEELETAKPAINLILGYKDKLTKFIANEIDNNDAFRLYDESYNDFASRLLKEISK